MILRPAYLDDTKPLAILGRNSFCAAFAHLYSDADLSAFLAEVYSEEAVAAEIADGFCVHRLAVDEANGRLLGFVKLRDPSWYTRHSDAAQPIALGQLYTQPEATGRGIGAALMDWSIAHARQHGHDAIQLSVWSENTGAQRFYARYGFNKIADITFKVGEQTDHEFLFELRLDQPRPPIQGDCNMSDFGQSSTADEVLANTDLSGKTAFITGGYSGLGQETARAMAARGAHVIVAGRDAEKADAAVEEIKQATGNDKIEAFVCDLGNQAQLAQAGKEARERFEKIDLLINNAGVMACPYAETADGFEMQFGTNHLGHFRLTNELLPLVEKGAKQGGSARIVNLASQGHHFAPVNLEDPNFDNRDYDKWVAYGNAKTANILHAVGLEKRHADKGIHAYALHPGGIRTNLGRHLTEDDMKALIDRATGEESNFVWKDIPQGAATTCYAATAPELEGKGGVYLEDCHVAEQDDESAGSGVRSYALDQDTAEELWTLSEKLTAQAA